MYEVSRVNKALLQLLLTRDKQQFFELSQPTREVQWSACLQAGPPQGRVNPLTSSSANSSASCTLITALITLTIHHLLRLALQLTPLVKRGSKNPSMFIVS